MIDIKDHEKAMSTLLEDLLKVSKWFFDFTGHCVVAILNKYFDPNKLEIEEEEINDVPDIRKVYIPFFTKKEDFDLSN